MMNLSHRNRHSSWLPGPIEDWKDRALGREEPRSSGPSTAQLLIAGAVVVGLGYLAWTYVAPDLRRYMKIHSM